MRTKKGKSPLQQSLLEDLVRTIVVAQLDIPFTDLPTKADLVRDLGADDLDIVEIRMAVEEVFSIEIPENAKGLTTTGKIAEFLAKNWSERGCA